MLILVSTVTGCVSISAFASLVCVPVGITSSAIGIKICAITAGLKKCKSIIKKKKKKHDKTVFLGKDTLITIEVLISKALIGSHISHDKFVSVNNVLRECNEMKEEIKNTETSVEYVSGSGVSVNEQLAEELHKAEIKMFKRREVNATFEDNIWLQI